MTDPLNRWQHHYIKRALEAFETGAQALARIAEALDAGDTTQTSRTAIESSGRYDELAIEGITSQSVAIDYGCDPPELIVHADGVRCPTPSDTEMSTHVLELPASETAEREN